VQSDGSARLTFRDAASFAPLRTVAVTLAGQPLEHLNELECAEGWIWANVYGSDRIVRVDPASGEVGAVVDAGGLLTAEESVGTDVLNGIAYRPDTETFYLTGKLWPKVFVVVFEPVP
jgi:glutaminyl-peptide cyclotransferase